MINPARPFNVGDKLETYLNGEPHDLRVSSWNPSRRTVHCITERGRSVEFDWTHAATMLRIGGRWVVEGISA